MRPAREAGCEAQFLKLIKQTVRQRGFGDFYGFVMVAQGSGELMVEHGVHAWDLGGLIPIIEEAGGKITAWDGMALMKRTHRTGSSLAINHKILRLPF